MRRESISVLDIFKIGIGPSSSHTLGPWRAALKFLEDGSTNIMDVQSLQVKLYGSLAKTGIGHGTDIAIMLGLSGENPAIFDTNQITQTIQRISTTKKLVLNRVKEIHFDPIKDIQFLFMERLPFHSNGLTFIFTLHNQQTVSETYYSIGGGFIVKENEEKYLKDPVELPFPIDYASDLHHWCLKTGLKISEVVMENEKSWRNERETKFELYRIWNVMKECIYKGCHTEGQLPGGLNVIRRASKLNKNLLNDSTYTSYKEWIVKISAKEHDFKYVLDWISCFALAVNEENASFGRVVTAPTNGAAGVIPAVLHYLICFHHGRDKILQFLLVAAEIGSIFKKGSTISAAMGGCQAEIGVSSSMAAAALTECLGGNVNQCLMAAEIAMEHHLGLTCDPLKGLVQIPCIERNTMGAIKAITASQLALQSNPENARVSLDSVINTMWLTALDMNHKYKETSEGGLAIQVPINIIEC